MKNILTFALVIVALFLGACTVAQPTCKQTVRIPVKEQYMQQPDVMTVNSYCIDYVGDQDHK